MANDNMKLCIKVSMLAFTVMWLFISSYLVHTFTNAQNDSSNSNANCTTNLRDYVYRARRVSVAFLSINVVLLVLEGVFLMFDMNSDMFASLFLFGPTIAAVQFLAFGVWSTVIARRHEDCTGSWQAAAESALLASWIGFALSSVGPVLFAVFIKQIAETFAGLCGCCLLTVWCMIFCGMTPCAWSNNARRQITPPAAPVSELAATRWQNSDSSRGSSPAFRPQTRPQIYIRAQPAQLWELSDSNRLDMDTIRAQPQTAAQPQAPQPPRTPPPSYSAVVPVAPVETRQAVYAAEANASTTSAARSSWWPQPSTWVRKPSTWVRKMTR